VIFMWEEWWSYVKMMLRVRFRGCSKAWDGREGCTITKCWGHSTTWREYRWLSSFEDRDIGHCRRHVCMTCPPCCRHVCIVCLCLHLRRHFLKRHMQLRWQNGPRLMAHLADIKVYRGRWRALLASEMLQNHHEVHKLEASKWMKCCSSVLATHVNEEGDLLLRLLLGTCIQINVNALMGDISSNLASTSVVLIQLIASAACSWSSPPQAASVLLPAASLLLSTPSSVGNCTRRYLCVHPAASLFLSTPSSIRNCAQSYLCVLLPTAPVTLLLPKVCLLPRKVSIHDEELPKYCVLAFSGVILLRCCFKMTLPKHILNACGY